MVFKLPSRSRTEWIWRSLFQHWSFHLKACRFVLLDYRNSGSFSSKVQIYTLLNSIPLTKEICLNVLTSGLPQGRPFCIDFVPWVRLRAKWEKGVGMTERLWEEAYQPLQVAHKAKVLRTISLAIMESASGIYWVVKWLQLFSAVWTVLGTWENHGFVMEKRGEAPPAEVADTVLY